tara:strand:- start:12248 stop:12844 length:597 start_codon:yes stop_codon:yes gene_type:complete
MKVITLDTALFVATCKQLELRVQDSGYKPDLIISIATGGSYVANNLDFGGIEKLEVTLKRDSSHHKERLKLSLILTRLPYFLLNWLRIIEFKILQKQFKVDLDLSKVDQIIKQIPEKKLIEYKSVLIVDDAVDSGHTLACVLEAVKKRLNPPAEVKMASIVVTTVNPYEKPEYFLYEGDLIRFPWSKDFKGPSLCASF